MEQLWFIVAIFVFSVVLPLAGVVSVTGIVALLVRQLLRVGRTRRILALLPEEVTFHTAGADRREHAELDRPGSDRGLWITAGASPRPTTWTDEASGDRTFDAEVHVSAAPARLRALLDADTRGAIRALLRAGGSVEGGVVHVGIPSDDPAAVAWRVATLRSVADRIHAMRPDELPERIATIAREDPIGEVRWLAFEAYAASGADAGPLAVALLADEDPQVRARVAPHAGPAGIAVLAELRAHDSACVRALALRGTAALPGAVAMLRDHVGDGVAVAEALGLTADSAAETRLIDLLWSEEPEARDAACKALGQVGTVAAVEALRACRSLESGAAVALIQGRVGAENRGALSLAATAGGEVSIAAHAGALSLPVRSG